MAAYTDYPELTKIDKSRFNLIRKAIFEVSQKLGSGISSPVPYDTAWVARIPDADKPTPAFPESLQWLRDHQRKDGGWGEEYPLSIHSNILNTFASVLALSQWNYESDKDRVQRGITALQQMIKSLPQPRTKDSVFEMMISSFLDDSREFKLDFEDEKFKWYANIGKENLNAIDKDMVWSKPNTYWSSLEAFGRMDIELGFIGPEITKYGLIAGQPSTTAFILRYARLRGKDFPEAEWALKNLSSQNGGGIPHLVPADNFELIHGLNFLISVGINPNMNVKHAALQRAIDALKSRVDLKKEIGFSSGWPVPDKTCTATAVGILHQISNKKDLKDPSDDKLTIKEEDATFQAFTSSTQSINLPTSLQSRFICQEDFNSHERLKYNDSELHNVSLFYDLLQYANSISDYETETINEVEIFLGRNQNKDGGWGGKNLSSLEETAYACLTLFRLSQVNAGVPSRINLRELVKFMNNTDSIADKESFWCYKVIFRSELLTEAVIVAAKYGLFQLQRFCMYTDALNENKMDFLDVELRDESNQLTYHGLYPLTRPEKRRQDIEVNKTEIEDICKCIFQVECFDPYMQHAIDFCLKFSYLFNDYNMMPVDRARDTALYVVATILDDLCDLHLEGKKFLSVACEAMELASTILRGDYHESDSLPDFELPRIKFVWCWFFYLRKVMQAKNWNANSFARTLKDGIFKNYAIAYKFDCNGIALPPKRYLQIKKDSVFLEESAHFASFLMGSFADLEKFKNDALFQKCKDCAKKASRIVADLPTVFRDTGHTNSDNYCIALMQEYDISLAEAMERATKKCNKEILKMYSLKKMILSRRKSDDEKIILLMTTLERYFHACLKWCLYTSRYEIRQDCILRWFNHEEKDITFTWNLCAFLKN